MHGCDNRVRFGVISIGVYFAFLLFTLIAQQHVFISIILLVIATAITALTTMRRLKDAKLIRNWLHISSGLFFVVGAIIIYSQQNAFYWLLLLPLAFSSLLLTYPSQGNHGYILGYFGPVDLSEYRQQSLSSSRIEPSFSQTAAINTDNIQQSTVHESYQQKPSYKEQSHGDIGEFIREKLLKKHNAKYAILTIILIIAAAIGATIQQNNSDELIETPQQSANETVEIQTEQLAQLYPLDFPDSFSLMMTEHSGLILSWPGDITENETIWRQITAIGDNSCQQLVFNNKKSIRTIKVKVDDNGDHFAYFSPLDSELLIQNLAFRSRFKLCGYDFSLKGTQALLGKTSPYNDYVSY